MIKNKLTLTWEYIKEAFQDTTVLKGMLLDFLKGIFLFFIAYITIIEIVHMENKDISAGILTLLMFIGIIYLYNNVIKIFWRKW